MDNSKTIVKLSCAEDDVLQVGTSLVTRGVISWMFPQQSMDYENGFPRVNHQELHHDNLLGPPKKVAKLVQITPITMVYTHIYIYIYMFLYTILYFITVYNGLREATYHCEAPHCSQPSCNTR